MFGEVLFEAINFTDDAMLQPCVTARVNGFLAPVTGGAAAVALPAADVRSRAAGICLPR